MLDIVLFILDYIMEGIRSEDSERQWITLATCDPITLISLPTYSLPQESKATQHLT